MSKYEISRHYSHFLIQQYEYEYRASSILTDATLSVVLALLLVLFINIVSLLSPFMVLVRGYPSTIRGQPFIFNGLSLRCTVDKSHGVCGLFDGVR